MQHFFIEWGIVVAVIAALPFLVVWGKKHARGAAGGAAMLIGLAFGSLFDPASGAATEAILKRRESGVEEDESGEMHRKEV